MGQPIAVDAETVWSRGVELTAADVDALFALPKLKRVQIASTNLTDERLERLCRLTQIEDLDISGTDITIAGVRHLRALPKLAHLRIKENALGNRASVRLAFLKSLETLNVKGIPFDDRGLLLLARLPRLTQLVTSHVTFTDAGIAAFHERLPACELIVDGLIR